MKKYTKFFSAFIAMILVITCVPQLPPLNKLPGISANAEGNSYGPYNFEFTETNDAATVDGNKVTFKSPDGHPNGVQVSNPFFDVNDNDGSTINLYITPGEDITSTSSIIPLFTVYVGYDEFLKFDLNGSRIYELNSAGEMNENITYSKVGCTFEKGKEYMITMVITLNGLEFYVDGKSVGKGTYTTGFENAAMMGAQYIVKKKVAKLFLGGNNGANRSSTVNNMPEGTVVRDMTGYTRILTADEVSGLYAGTEVTDPATATPAPTATPTVAPTSTPTVAPTDTPVPTATPAPTATPTVAPTDTASPTETVAPTDTVDPSNIPTAKLGDVNSDGIINAEDALLTLKIAAKLITDADAKTLNAADVNHDENINATDALLILQYSAGLINEFNN